MDGARAVEGLRASGRAALVVLAAALPFERIEPLAHLGPLQLSSVEVFLYAALALWGAGRAAAWLAGERDLGRALRAWPAAHWAVVALALVMFLSAALAPAARGAALKFALRSAGGMLLYAAAADLLRAPGVAARVAAALVLGAVVAAALVLAEVRWERVTAALRPFHPQRFDTLGVARGSGPFQYPNIAAMFLEAITPLAIALGAATSVSRARAPRGGMVRAGCGWAALAGGAVLLAAVLATASRAGLVGAGLALVVLAGTLAISPATRPGAVAALGALVVVGALASTSALARRYQVWDETAWYRADIGPAGGPSARLPAVLTVDEQTSEPIALENQGALTWSSASPTPVALAYHWLDAATGRLVVFNGRRTPLPGDVPPGGRVTVQAAVRAPAQPGRYVLWWDLVHEHATWFSERSVPGWRQTIEVRAATPLPAQTKMAALRAPEPSPGLIYTGGQTIPRRMLWRAAVAAFRARPLLGVGPDNFRHLYGDYLGLHGTDERLHANSLYFETLADLGLCGVAALGLLMATLVQAARRALRSPATPLGATRVLALGVALALGTFFVHGLLDYFLEFTPTYALFWLLAGTLVALAHPAPAVEAAA